MRKLIYSLLTTAAFSSAATIENVTCEEIGAGKYRLNFQASAPGEIRVYVSSSPDRIDSNVVVATVRESPAEISMPARATRVYFHLKPSDGPSRVVSVRRMPLAGAVNFRDLGGYATADGRFVRWGRVYRSNHLSSLTADDYNYVGSLGIKVVCDLRTDYERRRMPTNWKGTAPQFVIAPVSDDRTLSASLEQLKRAIESGTFPDLRAPSSNGGGQNSFDYSSMLFTFSRQFEQVLRRVSASDGAVVTHCTGGADRTGIYAALLLAALRVPEDVIVQDYLLTRTNFMENGNEQRLAADMQRLLDLNRAPDPAVFRRMMGSMSAQHMHTMFREIDTRYGSFQNFLQAGLGLSTDEIGRLRERLLEP